MQLMELFLSQGWKLTFASTATDSAFMIDFLKWPVSKVSILLNDDSFDKFVSELNPSIVVFDKFMIEEQFGWRVAAHCPTALRILDTIDLHFLRVARHKALKENRAFEEADVLKEEMAKREVASILRSDIALIISDFEMQLLRNRFQIQEAILHYVPFLLNPILSADIENWLAFEQRKHFITIGNFMHEPNWNAVLYLKQEVWPLIRKELPTAELHVYGSYSSQKVEALHNQKEGFYIKGRAADAYEVVSKAKVCLAPLRFGAGMKGKLVEAMQCGTPSVTTSIGAEGMHGRQSAHLWPAGGDPGQVQQVRQCWRKGLRARSSRCVEPAASRRRRIRQFDRPCSLNRTVNWQPHRRRLAGHVPLRATDASAPPA